MNSNSKPITTCKLIYIVKILSEQHFSEILSGHVWRVSSNSHFHILNNITHFFTHTFLSTLISKNFKQ